MTKRLDYEYVSNYFLECDCVLLEKSYKNNSTKMEFICSCGRTGFITLSNLQQGQRCYECGREKSSNALKHSFDFVKSFFEQNDCILLDKEYINARTKMNYICSCEREASITFDNFVHGNRCWTCRSDKLSAINMIYTTESVRNEILTINALLLSEYKGFHEELIYQCLDCGYIADTSYASIKQGCGCRQCSFNRLTGENSPHWRSELTQEEREGKRLLENYHWWKQEVKKRDNYTCQCCLKRGGRLNSHHILNYSKYKDIRCDLNNGITLCDDCHSSTSTGSFHNTYGTRNNTAEQLMEYILNKRKELGITNLELPIVLQ